MCGIAQDALKDGHALLVDEAVDRHDVVVRRGRLRGDANDFEEGRLLFSHLVLRCFAGGAEDRREPRTGATMFLQKQKGFV